MAKKSQPKAAQKRRTVSGKRGSATRKKKKAGFEKRGVIGIAVLCAGILALASQFLSAHGGVIAFFRDISRGLGGALCMLLPLVVCWAGLTLILFKERRLSVKNMVCGALVFVLVETLLQLFEIDKVTGHIVAQGGVVGYISFLGQSYTEALSCVGGGLIGALLAWPLVCALDVWGAAIVVICAMAGVLMVLTGVSFGGVGMYISELLDDLRAEREERREEREALLAAQEEEEAARRAAQAEKRKARRAEEEPAPQEEPPKRGKRKKAQPDDAQETMQEEPALFDQEHEKPTRPARKRNAAASAQGALFIERDDAFDRQDIGARKDPRDSRRKGKFTVEEAEAAFLYGMNAQAAQEHSGEQSRTDEEDAFAGGDMQPGEAYDISGEPEAADVPWDTEPEYDADHGEDMDEPMPAASSVFSAGAATASAPARRRSERQNAPVPAAQMAAQWAKDAKQEEELADPKTIVQLRGNRLDGTPVVMPQKDTHEGPSEIREEYTYPPIDLLDRSNATRDPNQQAKIEAGAKKLLATLDSFGVQAKLTHVTHGPAITRYELQPAPGVKVSRIVNLVDDIALNMASDGVRIEAPIPGKPAVGIEIPNDKTEMVTLREVLESPEMTREKSPTAVALGKGISGAPVVADLAKMPHVLIAGATGSGKSVCISTIINSIIYRSSPREVRLILIDPKVVELSVYNGIPHLLVPVVTDPKKASAALSWAVVEMEHRYKRFETLGVRNIKGYNAAIGPDEEPMSKIIVIIDELADLMMVAPGEVEESICRLAQLARAAGIHLVIATQRPSVNVITGVIKANIPSRIAFAVSSQIDSRTILDAGGAEKLLGKGDMLYAPQGAGKPTRVQGCFVSDEEVQRVVDYVRGKHAADYSEDVIEQLNTAAQEEKAAEGSEESAGGEPVDEMLAKAIDLAVEAGQVSISMLQRRLRVGYARAGRLVDEMTLRGIAAEAEGPTKPRTVLISREEWRRMQENQE